MSKDVIFVHDKYFARSPNWEEKESLINWYIRQILRKTAKMFEYDGLPDTIPKRILELHLQTQGYTGIVKHDGQLYSFYGGLGGQPNYNYMPTKFIVNNPYLNLSKVYDIDENCIIIPNDTMYDGLLPTLNVYASRIVENLISMRMVTINMRSPNMAIAPDENTATSVNSYFKDIERGKLSAIISKNFMFKLESVPVNEQNSANMLTDLIESEQYIKASLYNELGLQANYNMKRESLNSNESQLNRDALFPSTDDMLEMREIGLDKVNTMYGVNWKVRFSSSWEYIRDEVERTLSQMKEQVDLVEGNGDGQEDVPKSGQGEEDEDTDE